MLTEGNRSIIPTKEESQPQAQVMRDSSLHRSSHRITKEIVLSFRRRRNLDPSPDDERFFTPLRGVQNDRGLSLRQRRSPSKTLVRTHLNFPIQKFPFRIIRIDQFNFLVPFPAFYLLFSLYCDVYILIMFIIYQIIAPILRGKRSA